MLTCNWLEKRERENYFCNGISDTVSHKILITRIMIETNDFKGCKMTIFIKLTLI